MNKFEKLIEYIINDEDQKARELFHDIVVEKSRDIYESIMDEESMEEMVHGGRTHDLVSELEQEEAMGETEGDEFSLDHQDGSDEDDNSVAGDFPADGDSAPADGEAGAHQEIEDKVMNIDAKLDELLAKFDEIMGEPAGNDNPMDEPTDNPMDEPTDNPMEMMEAEDEEDEEEDKEEKKGNPFAKKDEKKKTEESRKSATELMREYVEKIGDIYGGQGDANEGDAVGAGGKKTAINTKPGAQGPGANFGGDNGNIVNGKGNNESPDGKPVPKANNEYTKGQGEIKSGNVNVPGGKAGSPKSTGHEYTKDAKGAEGQTTDGKVPVATKSVQKQNTGIKR